MHDKKDKKPKQHVKNLNKSIKVDLNDLSLYELCFSVNDLGERIFTGELHEIVLLERYAPEKETKREFNPASIEAIESDGIVKFWDLVRDQWMYVDWTAPKIPIILHILNKQKLKFEDEIELESKRNKKKNVIQEELNTPVEVINEIIDSPIEVLEQNLEIEEQITQQKEDE